MKHSASSSEPHAARPGYRPGAVRAALATVLLATGCVKETSVKSASRLVIPPGETYELAERRDDLPDTPMITQTSMASVIAVDQLGIIPYDGFTLPITSQTTDAQYVAVQDGSPVPVDVFLAKGAGAMVDAGVTIFSCSAGMEPEAVRTHSGSILLGRNSNQEGVLVEKANADGSRWIGIAPWSGDDIRWLVRDGNVNAFGWIGEDATLVYAQRRVGEERFELVTRRPDGSAWRIEEPLPYSWVYPILTPSGEGLFALRRGEGFADLAWGRTGDTERFRESLTLHRTSDRVDDLRAWETLAASTGGTGVSDDHVPWFSRELRRLALWSPSDRTTRLFPPGTVAACTHPDSRDWLVTGRDALEMAAILKTTTATSLVFDQPWIARTGIRGNVVIMLAREGLLELAILKTGPVEPPAPTAAEEAPAPSTPEEAVPIRTGTDPRLD